MMHTLTAFLHITYWGTTEKTFFTTPGTYRVYLYPKNMNSDYYKSGNWENYSAKGELVVE